MVKSLPPIALDDEEFKLFEEKCKELNLSKSEVFRRLVKKFLEENVIV